MKTNELKKGTRILLSNGWYGTLKDNRKGTVRDAEVEGVYTEIGSIYTHDIKKAFVDESWIDLEYTKDQIKLKRLIELL